MKKENLSEILLVGGVIVACSALAFLFGMEEGRKKEKKLVVNQKGELKEQEVD